MNFCRLIMRPVVLIVDGKVGNEDEIRKYVNTVPVSDWDKGDNHYLFMLCCDLQMIKLFLGLYPAYSKQYPLRHMAAFSIVCRAGKYLEEIIVLGLEHGLNVDYMFPELDYGQRSVKKINCEYSHYELDYDDEDNLVTLMELAYRYDLYNSGRILMRNGAGLNGMIFREKPKSHFEYYSTGYPGSLYREHDVNFINLTTSAVAENRRAARILLGIKKYKKIYPTIDRFIFREIALAIYSARDTI
jgi:hypothetical protein